LIGAATEELAAAFGEPRVERDETLAHAVEHAVSVAQPGDVVLLSPACASYDQYDNFEQRGDEFRGLVTALGAPSSTS
jgi:UDP-N-acetylmuramoylalanine--D-glutamate ligase